MSERSIWSTGGVDLSMYFGFQLLYLLVLLSLCYLLALFSFVVFGLVYSYNATSYESEPDYFLLFGFASFTCFVESFLPFVTLYCLSVSLFSTFYRFLSVLVCSVSTLQWTSSWSSKMSRTKSFCLRQNPSLDSWMTETILDVLLQNVDVLSSANYFNTLAISQLSYSIVMLGWAANIILKPVSVMILSFILLSSGWLVKFVRLLIKYYIKDR